jgi:hypothetical protein
LKVRDNTLNAFVDDLGSPIDSVVVASILASGFSGAIAVVEPTTLQYWLYLNGTIYVFSRFLSSKVNARSKYSPVYYSGATAITFTPTAMEVLNGKIYIRSGSDILVFGGTLGTSYDASVATLETPYLDFKSPGTRKLFNALNIAVSGAWSIQCGSDPQSGILDTITAITDSSFDIGRIPWSSQGSHIKLKAVTTGQAAAVFSALGVHYELAEEV